MKPDDKIKKIRIEDDNGIYYGGATIKIDGTKIIIDLGHEETNELLNFDTLYFINKENLHNIKNKS